MCHLVLYFGISLSFRLLINLHFYRHMLLLLPIDHAEHEQ